ncbi:hypothetical protein MFMK1_001561 [Metallumcola ferriviriculae]|uniref:PaaX-like C-terminal domain-containing protein n=1 Tax=Metallumcola ferriviriculae TaxID=3039180 RepID=A0AAU0ULV2_9FIRM|nr:hypothetical protein MFMK1_001561 [Desulfitibacteraceae bacterium MK1]
MKIILRKKDSVTSIVLFIFNIYGEYTNQYSIQLRHLIDFMMLFNKNETSTRMGLSRMVKAGILINRKVDNEVVYQLTEFGLDNINIWNDGITNFFKRYQKRFQAWDGKWSAIILLDFNKSDKERQPVIDELTEMGLREVNRNNWICPYQVSDDVKALTAKENIRYLALNGAEIQSDVSGYKLLDNVFEVASVRKKYLGFLEMLQEIKNEIDGLGGNEGYCLALLFKLGWNFYDIAVSDPALPKEFLEDWEGDRVVEEFQRLRTYLYQKVVQYFIKKNDFTSSD